MKIVSMEKLSDAILKIADGFESLLKDTNLDQKAIIALLKAMPGMSEVSKGTIVLVLDNLVKLKKWYIIEDKK